MGLFKKLRKKKTSSGKNEINNRLLKQEISNHAISLLEEGKDYENLANTTIDFGYLFTFEKHGLEALFKITTDKTIRYFACQKNSILQLEFNETLFQNTTQQFLEFHAEAIDE